MACNVGDATVAESQTTGDPGRPRSWQFRLRTRLLFTGGVAVSLSLWDGHPLPFAIPLFATVAIPALALPCQAARPYSALFFVGVASVAVALEFYAAHLAYYTIGEIASAAYIFLILVLNGPFILLGLFRRTRRLAYAWLLTLAALLVPYQLYLEVCWYRLDDEARAIIAYVSAHNSKHGSYPADLSGYTFRHPDLRGEINYNTTSRPGFYLGYSIGSWMTSHDYSPQGGWFYYPD